MRKTLLLDQVTVALLAAETDDMTIGEHAAVLRIAVRLEGELHRQTTWNPYLIEAPRLWVWPTGVTASQQFEVPDEAWRTATGRFVLPQAHEHALRQARLALGDPDRSLRGVACTYPSQSNEPHWKGCVCRGIGIARHLAKDVLPDGSPWLLLSQSLRERQPA